MRFNAHFSDGSSAQLLPVSVQQIDQTIHFIIADNAHYFSLEQCELSPRIGSTPQYIDLPNGARLVSEDFDALAAIFTKQSPFIDKLSHFLESKWLYLLASLAVTCITAWWLVNSAIPAMADSIAKQLPSQILAQVSDQSLDLLAEHYLSDSELSLTKRGTIASYFEHYISQLDTPYDYQLHFYKGNDLQANAFALPNGHIVITDELVELLVDDERIMSVLLHEVGHVEQRHGLRNVLQQLGIFILFGMFLNDLGDVSGVFSGIPMAVLQLDYSRQFEYQADRFAIEQIHQADSVIQASSDDFIKSFELMSEYYQDSGDVPEFLSTHPLTENRINQIELMVEQSQAN
ncbi:M48 family metallopeptidase [Catenovulum sp. SM1970]|uniref:M48 family metallopeptidase n=1 Tax=Marinifaba aquimaris TaxID=2741323 RepID=UPI001571FFEE|nr:M48 family metallopeptidase [Marinifaba aquimaris]NTS75821.1 M48 family metallopeptidase [Marinifaba aquimaris]